jgi:hypothetical protein
MRLATRRCPFVGFDDPGRSEVLLRLHHTRSSTIGNEKPRTGIQVPRWTCYILNTTRNASYFTTS